MVDSVSVATTFQAKLAEAGVIFCSFSDAVHNHPDLVRAHLGSVVPYKDNFFATLNSAVFTDGSFCCVPKGVYCPMELSTSFRINSAGTGQFERTLIVAEDGATTSQVSTRPRSTTLTGTSGSKTLRSRSRTSSTSGDPDVSDCSRAGGSTPIARLGRGRPAGHSGSTQAGGVDLRSVREKQVLVRLVGIGVDSATE